MAQTSYKSDYGSPGYWDERYSGTDGGSFDWFQSYSQLKPTLEPFLRADQEYEILIPGCGNSSLGADLYDEGYINVTNIDTSSVVINQMNDKYADREEMEYTVMDATNLEFLPDACFNLVIDKGMFDSQLCGERNITNVECVTKEMYRVLKPGGIYLCISHGVPNTRMTYLNPKTLNWQVEFRKIAKPMVENGHEVQGPSDHHFLYICRKPK
ncbi:hypothetical protein TrLO_g8149 [Triparma laevis f. longispina]|uniref:Methyltransferase type 11 domain-containing protein n=1 Tax=Triparma laevis f. longispina TaxID=1714387 RepID=A0A9W7C993_9STRA|nr:hypothetical protein TrLO_g8149 [Triparma laevis f. longispina]